MYATLFRIKIAICNLVNTHDIKQSFLTMYFSLEY
jgi:hypothetical protein